MPLLGSFFLLSDDGNLTYPKKKLLMLVQFFKITFNPPQPLFCFCFVVFTTNALSLFVFHLCSDNGQAEST